jgi:hypothetical protein
LLFAQLAVIAATMPIARTGIALIMYAFALKIAACRLERDCEPNASNSLRLVRKFWANKLIGAKPRRR